MLVGINYIMFFSNLDSIDIKNPEFGTVAPDYYYHLPLVNDVLLTNGRLSQNQGPSYSLFYSNLSIRTFMLVLFCFIL